MALTNYEGNQWRQEVTLGGWTSLSAAIFEILERKKIIIKRVLGRRKREQEGVQQGAVVFFLLFFLKKPFSSKMQADISQSVLKVHQWKLKIRAARRTWHNQIDIM